MTNRGWALFRAVALAMTAVLLSPVSPVVLVTVPLALVLLAFRPRDLRALALAAVIMLLAFGSWGEERTVLWYAERGWALAVGGGFVAATLWLQGRRLLTRAITALGAAGAVVALVSLTRPSLPAEMEYHVTAEFRRAADAAYRLTSSVASGGLREDLGGAIFDWVGIQVSVYPALLALASLAALGVGWYVLRRFSGTEEALPPLREFRFNDHLVWILIAGLVLLLVPWDGGVGRAGENAVLFMGGMYLLRGIGVLVWIGSALATSAWSAAAWVLVGLLLYPLAAGAALVLGLCDTWVDLRARLSGALQRG